MLQVGIFVINKGLTPTHNMECVGAGDEGCPNAAKGDAMKKGTDGKPRCEKCQGVEKSHSNAISAEKNAGYITKENEKIDIVNPVLAYIVFAMDSGTMTNVRNAVLGHFTLEQVIQAKHALWDSCGSDTLGEQHLNRRDGPTRTGLEAHVSDILNALSSLDGSDSSPRFLIAADDLRHIPRSHPEELNSISLVDRLNRLEHRCQSMQTLMDKQLGSDLKYRVEKLENAIARVVPSYAKVVQPVTSATSIVPDAKACQPRIHETVSHVSEQVATEAKSDEDSLAIATNDKPVNGTMKSKAEDKGQRSILPRGLTVALPPLDTVPFSSYTSKQNHVQGVHETTYHATNTGSSHDVELGRGDGTRRGRGSSTTIHGHGRGQMRGQGRGQGRGGTRVSGLGSHWPSMNSLDRFSTNSDRCNTSYDRWGDGPSYFHDDSHLDTGWEVPYASRRKQIRAEKRRKATITGTVNDAGRFKGAPAPGRSFFVSRVDSEASPDDLRSYLSGRSIDVRDLVCISHTNSKYKSFKLTVPASQSQDLLSPEMWPEGVNVRKYVHPKREHAY